MTNDDLLRIFPRVIEWITHVEKDILREGKALTPEQCKDAQAVGVRCADKVRLLRVMKIPVPPDAELARFALEEKLITESTGGLTAMYGIFITESSWNNRRLVAHELTHTAQYEELGGISNFMSKYFPPCIGGHYPNTPMEIEAEEKAKAACG